MAPKYRILHLPLGVRYAVSAAAYLSSRPGAGFCLLDEVSARLGLPRAFLAKVLQRLANRGILDSRRGANGGYRLARPARDISLADVVAAVGDASEGGGDCAIRSQKCSPESPCFLHDPMAKAETYLWKTLARTNLKSVGRGLKSRVAAGGAPS